MNRTPPLASSQNLVVAAFEYVHWTSGSKELT